MKTLVSKYIKKATMPAAEVNALEGDITTFNTLLHTMVSDLGKPRIPGAESIHRQYKQYGPSDYFVTSLERAAAGILGAAKEALTLDIKTKERQLARIGDNIAKKTTTLSSLYQAKESLKARSLARKKGGPLPPFHNSFGCLVKTRRKADNLVFTVKSLHGERPDQVFENEYLFETLYLDPRIRRTKSAIRHMEHRRHNLRSRLEKLKREAKAGAYHICYGGKKSSARGRRLRTSRRGGTDWTACAGRI